MGVKNHCHELTKLFLRSKGIIDWLRKIIMTLAINKTAKRDYEIIKTFTAGLVLSGAEVKSLRLKHASLKSSFVKIVNGEAFLINAQINPYEFANNQDYDPKRTRKLLLKKKEINLLKEATDKKNITIVAIKIFLAGNKIKLEIGIGRGKKEYEKRSELKKKAIQRDVDREIKQKIKMR